MTSLVDITIRNCRNYLECILEIENLSFPSPWSLKAFKEEIGNPISHLWGLTVDEVLTGYTCFCMFDIEIQLINLAVHPHERGKGFGHYFLTKMIESAVSKGKKYIWLEVRPSNLAALRLYEKSGFDAVDRRPQYYADTHEDAIVMALTLSSERGYHLASN